MVGFASQPKPNPSPIVGEQVFHIILEDLVNDRYAWTNGVEYLSYVKHDDDKVDKELGTWIIGSEPGVVLCITKFMKTAFKFWLC
jgi:hypothetical protein